MIGCGTVGGGVLELLDRQEQRARRALRRAVPSHEARGARPREAAAAAPPTFRGPTRALDLVADPDVDVIVEVAGGDAVEPALTAALAAGKPVVTANKALLAKQARRARRARAAHRDAAAVRGRCRRRDPDHPPPVASRRRGRQSLMAIVNGTCNYIITRLEQDELPLDRAIAEAQALGLAEADPSADIARPRRRGEAVDPRVPRVRRVGPARRAAGARHRRAVAGRLRPRRGDGLPHPADRARRAHAAMALTGGVEPLLLPDWHLLASVEEEYNAVYLRLRVVGRPVAVRQGRRRAADRDRGARRPDRARAGQLGAVARAARGSSSRPRRRAVTTCGSPPSRTRASRAAIDSLVRRAGLIVQNRAARGEPLVTHHGFLISPSRRRARSPRSSTSCASSAASSRRCGSESPSERDATARSARARPMRPRATMAPRPRAPRRRSTRNAPWLHPERRTIQRDLARLAERRRVAGGEGRVHRRRRRRVVGAAAPLRALRHARHRAS